MCQVTDTMSSQSKERHFKPKMNHESLDESWLDCIHNKDKISVEQTNSFLFLLTVIKRPLCDGVERDFDSANTVMWREEEGRNIQVNIQDVEW